MTPFSPTSPELTLPSLTLPSTSGPLTLSAPRAGLLILYFYPKDATPGCTNEALQFAALFPEFKKRRVTIWGVSRDALVSHQKFKEKQMLPFELLADTDETLCRHFDVIKPKTLYGKTVRGIERSTFVIDRQGHVLNAWRKVKVEGHAQEVLNWIDQHPI